MQRYGYGYISVGGIMRNHDGLVLPAYSRMFTGRFFLKAAKAIVLHHGLTFALENGFHVQRVECDALQVIWKKYFAPKALIF